MEIRKAKTADAIKVKNLLVQLGYTNALDTVEKALSNQPHGSEIYVATRGGDIVAFMSLIYFYYFPSSCNICRITGITVDQTLRGCGIGSKLISFALEKGRQNNCEQLEVTTSLLREKTQKYYENLGFIKASYKYYQTIDS